MANMNPDSFLEELREDFKIEAAEHIQSMNDNLLLLEKTNDAAQIRTLTEQVFREIHSMKGAARAVNLIRIEHLCMSMEGYFQELKKGSLLLKPAAFDVLYQAVDVVQRMVLDMANECRSIPEHVVNQLTKNIDNLIHQRPLTPSVYTTATGLNPKPDPGTSTTSRQPDPAMESNDGVAVSAAPENNPTAETIGQGEKETVRIATTKLYDILRMGEELTALKTVLDFQLIQYNGLIGEFAAYRRQREEHLDDDHYPGRSYGAEVENQKEWMKNFEQKLLSMGSDLDQIRRAATRGVDDLVFGIKTTLMFPLSSLLAIVPKMVRDLSKESDKEVDLVMAGGEIEIDRRILEEMKDPLIHLIRNSIDHGIEKRAQRLSAGKPTTGKLSVTASFNDDHKIEISIRDDGGGLNPEKLIASAIKAGVIKAEAAKTLSDKEVQMLVFASGVSTSDFLTDVSGRGLGMAIVAEKIHKIGGTIAIASERNKGTTFTITLPQMMAAFRGIIVRAADQVFLIPSNAVEKAVRIVGSQVRTVESKRVMLYQNEHIAMVNLSEVLGITTRRQGKRQTEMIHALVIAYNGSRMALVVDEVFGEHEGLIKKLGPQLHHVTHIAGATLLGDGRIIPVIHTGELFRSASAQGATGSLADTVAEPGAAEENGQKYLLVAEDSITIRNMLRNLLEAAGFKVKTAVDGQDAFNQLLHDSFDLVVSDIEMPRMNGFELTAKIRDHKDLSHMPVILVTALESADDRNRGMNAGANAYITKSSFEKSNLIETIHRLI